MASIFRKKAIERLASPEQLDQMLQVTSAATWLGFLSIAALLIVAVIWSIFGQIPQKTDGIGILLPQGDFREFSLQEIPAPYAGIITELSINQGDQVRRGQVIAQQQPLDSEIQQAGISELQSQLTDMQSEHEALDALDTRSLALAKNQRDREKAGLEAIVAAKTTNLQHLRTIANNKEGLSRDGNITMAESVQAASDVAAAEAELNAFQHQLIQLELSLEQLQLDTSKQQTQRNLQLARLQTRVEDLQSKLLDQSQIVSSFDGTIVQVSAVEGNEVDEGERIALLEQDNNSILRLQGFVPIFTGKEIDTGMLAQISPSTIKREEFGFLNGSVSWISDYPQDSRAILNLVDDQELVDEIVRQTKIPLQIELQLTPGNGTNQYSWTTGFEPPQKLSVGVQTSFSVITGSKRPIELVIPYIRNMLGIN